MGKTHVVFDSKGTELSRHSWDNTTSLYVKDAPLNFVVSQLSFIEATAYAPEYPNIKFDRYVPQMFAPETDTSVSYKSYNAVGQGKFLSPNAKNIPRVTLTGNLTTVPTGYAGLEYSYSIEELRQSQKANIPLTTYEAQEAYRIAQEHMQRVAFNGDADLGLNGLYTNPALTAAKLTSAINWETGTPDDILALLNSVLDAVFTGSSEVNVANFMIIPTNMWLKINSTPRGINSDKTILEYFVENNMYTSMTGNRLPLSNDLTIQTAASGAEAGNGRLMAYEKNDRNLFMPIMIPWRALPAQYVGYETIIPTEYKFGGVDFRYEKSGVYLDLEYANPLVSEIVFSPTLDTANKKLERAKLAFDLATADVQKAEQVKLTKKPDKSLMKNKR